MRSRRSTPRRLAGRGTARSSGSPATTALRPSATATPTRPPPSGRAGRRFRVTPPTNFARPSSRAGPITTGRSTGPRRSSGRSGGSSGSTAATRATLRSARSAATAPPATWATPAAAIGRRAWRRPSPPNARLARGRAGEDRPRLALCLPAAGRRDPARRLPLREPPAARPRRPDPDLVARPPALVGRRHHPDRQGLLDAGQRLGGDDHALAPVRVPGPRHARTRAVRPAPLPRAVRAVPLADHPAALDEREHRDLP